MASCGWEISKCGCDLENVQLFHLEGKVWSVVEFSEKPFVGGDCVIVA